MRRTAVYTYRPYMHPCVLPMHWQGQTSRECIAHGVSYAIHTIFSPLCLSKHSAALPISHYVLRITYPCYPSLSGTCTWEYYGPRITYPYYVSSAESPPEKAIGTTHYVSVVCIKSRKPAGEGYGVRITYPYYVSSAEP